MKELSKLFLEDGQFSRSFYNYLMEVFNEINGEKIDGVLGEEIGVDGIHQFMFEMNNVQSLIANAVIEHEKETDHFLSDKKASKIKWDRIQKDEKYFHKKTTVSQLIENLKKIENPETIVFFEMNDSHHEPVRGLKEENGSPNLVLDELDYVLIN